MTRRSSLFCAVCALLLSAGIAAADVTVTAVVEPGVAPVGSEVTLVVSVEGKFTKSTNPELPPLDDFTVYQAGTSQNFSFGTGGASSSLEFRYVLVPKKVGSYMIEPIQFRAGDKIYTANPVKLEVVASQSAPAPPAATEEATPSELGEKGDQPIFVQARADKDTVFVNEQVTWTLGFYTDGRLNLVRTPEYTPPTAEGFWAEELPTQQSAYKQIRGRRYLVNEVKRAYFASAPGKYAIGPARIDLVIDDFGGISRDRFFDDFFNRSFGSFGFGKPVSLKTKELSVTVLPLPARGRPQDFSGLVGRGLELAVQTDKKSVQVGEPINLTLEVRGSGNFKTMSAPKLVQPEGFKMYESGTSSDVFREGNVVSGRKKYEYVLVPQAEGTKSISPVSLSYFDPAAKVYKTVQSEPISLDIMPGTAEQGRKVVFTGAGEDIEVLGRDINFIHPVPAMIRPPSRGTLGGSALFWVFHAVPLAALLASIAVERRRRRFRDDVRLARATRAIREAEKKLEAARRLLKQNRANETYPLVAAAIRGYLADKMNASMSGLTRDEIDRFLSELNAGDEATATLKTVLNACDGAQYAPSGSAAQGSQAAAGTIESAAELIETLEKRSFS